MRMPKAHEELLFMTQYYVVDFRRTNRGMRTACALLCCSLRSALGAATLQDHSESWHAAGLDEQLVQAQP